MIPIQDFLDTMRGRVKSFPIVKNKKFGIYNIPAAFDIETTSWEVKDTKLAAMYIWQFGIDDLVTYGRTWDEFLDFLDEIKKIFNLSENLRLRVYVHNLAYEWQFIRKMIKWKTVFLVDTRKPVYALSDYDIEFRCSLLLSGGKSLAAVAKDLMNVKIKIMN